MNRRLIKHFFLLLVGVALLYGCTTTSPVSYYLMSPVPGAKPETAHGDIKLGVGPVQLADYLNRTNLVTRSSATRIDVPYDHRWGSALDSHLIETLAENLRQRLGLEGVLIYPWQAGTKLDFQLTADVGQFVYMDSTVHLDASWHLRDRAKGRFIDGSSRIREPATGEYDDIVDAMSRALGKLADEIAQKVQQTEQWKSK